MQPALLQPDRAASPTALPTDPLRAEPASMRLEALGLMTAGIVHDLGNIIQVLSSTLDVLDQHPTIRATRALQATVDRAVRSVERARAIVEQILSFARETDTKQEAVDVATCLMGIERLLRWIGKNDIHIDTCVAADTPPVTCSRWNLENAILNLAFNARDAMPDGGELLMSATPYRLRGIVAGVELRVSDTGRGMSPETLARAFDPFFTTKASARGAGLGLMMVRRFAQEIGGSVTIESKLGAGTAVTLRLPLRPTGRP